jgi:hypothetical protein
MEIGVWCFVCDGGKGGRRFFEFGRNGVLETAVYGWVFLQLDRCSTGADCPQWVLLGMGAF